MPTWVWVLIAVSVVVVVAVVVWRRATFRRRAEHLREQFDLRPLSPSARGRYVESWRAVQSQFVDDPRTAVASADSMIQSVMRDCGYPVEDFEQRAADLSVEHADVVEHYREGHRLAEESSGGGDSTEDLRLAMQHYRSLFEELVDSNGDADGATNETRRASAAKER